MLYRNLRSVGRNTNMKKIVLLIAVLSMILVASSEPYPTIRFTVVNKSGMDIAVQLRSKAKPCAKCADTTESRFYYLTVLEGTREKPTEKTFIIDRDTYGMQLFYIETWDPVYGFECGSTTPNALLATRNIRMTVLPCDELPARCALGERGYWKYIPFPVTEYFKRVWIRRLIY